MKHRFFFEPKAVFLLIACFFLHFQKTQAQANPYYYYKGKKIILAKDWSKIYVSGSLALSLSSLPPAVGTVTSTGISYIAFQPSTWAIIELAGTISSEEAYATRLQQLVQILDGVATISPFVADDIEWGGRPIGLPANSIAVSHLFHVKLNQLADSAILKQRAVSEAVDVIQQNPFMPLWFTLACNAQTVGNSLQKCNNFWETGDYADVDPAFMFDFRTSCTNDSAFSALWGLYNSADTVIDIDACKAWNITRGAGVKVAVIDYGIERTHVDLWPQT